MLIAIIGGRSEDEEHLARIAAKSGQHVEFYRPVERDGSPRVDEARGPRGLMGALDDFIAPREDEPRFRPRALVFEALDRPDLAIGALHAVRRDPYFDNVAALIAVNAEQAKASELPGAFDDFVFHPFISEELRIRIDAVEKRRSGLASSNTAALGGMVVDEASHDVYVNGRAVQLTAREFALFSHFCEWRGKVLSREHLLARVWGSRYAGGRRTVDIHVRRLRAKLGAALPLETLRGRGYRLLSTSPTSTHEEPATRH